MARTAQVVSLLYNRHFNKTKTQRAAQSVPPSHPHRRHRPARLRRETPEPTPVASRFGGRLGGQSGYVNVTYLVALVLRLRSYYSRQCVRVYNYNCTVRVYMQHHAYVRLRRTAPHVRLRRGADRRASTRTRLIRGHANKTHSSTLMGSARGSPWLSVATLRGRPRAQDERRPHSLSPRR